MIRPPLARTALLLLLPARPAASAPPEDPPRPLTFERIVIDDRFPGAYQVEIADVNGDKKPDIVALGGGTCAWYENPSWKKRIISTPKDTPDIITSATADLDGDGKAEVAIGYDFAMNAPKRGKLLLAVQGKADDDPWTFRKIADVPSIHRVRWGEFDGDPKTRELVAAPIFGPDARPPSYDDPASIEVFGTGADPKGGPWRRVVLDRLPAIPLDSRSPKGEWTVPSRLRRPVLHSIELIPYRDANVPAGRSPVSYSLLTADNLGIAWIAIGADLAYAYVVGPEVDAPPGDAPRRGCSEVRYGRLADGKDFLATIEPWHGSRVAIHERTRARMVESGGAKFPGFAPSLVIDDTLDEGHALCVADVDGDGDGEVFAGHRGKDHRVSMFKFDRADRAWKRTIIDRDIAAQDLRGGDIDGDGRPDVVAVGGSTHNVIWYRPR